MRTSQLLEWERGRSNKCWEFSAGSIICLLYAPSSHDPHPIVLKQTVIYANLYFNFFYFILSVFALLHMFIIKSI